MTLSNAKITAVIDLYLERRTTIKKTDVLIPSVRPFNQIVKLVKLSEIIYVK